MIIWNLIYGKTYNMYTFSWAKYTDANYKPVLFTPAFELIIEKKHPCFSDDGEMEKV